MKEFITVFLRGVSLDLGSEAVVGKRSWAAGKVSGEGILDTGVFRRVSECRSKAVKRRKRRGSYRYCRQ